MKKLSLKDLFGLSLFFILILTVLIVIPPVYKRTTAALDSYVQSLCRRLEDSYGISVSYRSLSPSVLSQVRINGIEIDTGHSFEKTRVLGIRKAVLRYNLLRLLTGNADDALIDLTVDGIAVDVSRDNSELFALIHQFTRKNPQEEKNKNPLDFEHLAVSVPFDIFIKNLHIQYSDMQQIADIFLKQLFLGFEENTKLLSVRTSGAALYSRTLSGKNVSASFLLDGMLTENLNGSLMNIRFSDVTDGNFRLGRLNLRGSYSNGTAELRTVQNAYPFFIFGTYDINTADARLELMTQDLSPGTVLSVKHDTELVKQLRALSVGIRLSAEYNLKSRVLRYDSDGTVSFAPKGADNGIAVTYDFSGDSEKVSVRSFEASGKALDVSFSGDFTFETLALSGAAQIYRYTLPNGRSISTELYFDPLDNGFVCFAPQLLLEQKAFTALQLTVFPADDSIDFSFELSDYAHYDTAEPGTIRIDGSFLTDTKYLQANMNASGLYVDSVMQTAAFFGKNESESEFAFLSPFVFNSELYFSSDLRTFSYNVPYVVVANTKKDNQFVYISLDGNDSSVQVSQLDVIAGGQSVHFSGFAEKIPDTQEGFIMLDAQFASVPYHFTGSMRNNSVSIRGDYGVAFDIHRSGKVRYDGAFSMEELPVALSDSIVALSVDSGFSVTAEDGLNLLINRILVQEAGGRYAFSPRFEISSASISKYGAFFNQIEYADAFSALKGKSEVLWSMSDGFFDSAQFSLDVKSQKSDEAITVSAEFSNPGREALSGEFVRHSLYMTVQAVIQNFDLNRFTTETNPANLVTATVIASGTLDNPYVGLNVDSLGFRKGGKIITGSGSAYVEENMLAVEHTKLSLNKLDFSDIAASFDLSTFAGSASAVLDTVVMKKNVHAPLELFVSESYVKQGKLLPSEFAATLSCSEVSGSFFKKTFPLELTVLRSSESISVFTSEAIGISGLIENSGNVAFSVAAGKPVAFNLDGFVSGDKIDFSLDSVRVDIGELYSYIDVPKFHVYKGILRGGMNIAGVRKDPDFTGKFVIDGADFSLPMIIPSHITAPQIALLMNHTQIDIPEVKTSVKNNSNPLFASGTVYLDRWAFDRLEANVRTPDKKFVPADFNIRLAEFIGDASVNLNLVYEDRYLDVSGDIFVKNLNARAKTREIATTSAPLVRAFYVRAGLDITLLQHCTFRFDPVLRAVLTPNSKFSLKYDMEEADMQIDGEIMLRSGDIAYLSRSFYLKEGVLRFNNNEDTFNPMVTLTAETREKDENGNDVRLILSATNQYLFDLNPQISSIPAKSETEISQMLGQIAVGDSDDIGGFLLSAGDYALQSTIGRNIENKLRDFLNFDILSIRTSVLQNALKMSLPSNKDDTDRNSYEIGNYLDNSTVYIGKYFGSALYADALLHWTYDEMRVDDKTTAGGLVFQPEIGLEMESPFANIRWNMAPDISALMNSRLAGTTSVTLSWKFSF